MYTVLIFVSVAAAALYLLSSLLQLLRGRARAGFWGTTFIFLLVACALIAVYETPTLPLVRILALVTGSALIAVDFIFLLFELRLKPRAMNTSRAALGIGAGVLILAAVVAAPYVHQYLTPQRAFPAGAQIFGAPGTTQNVALVQGPSGAAPAGQPAATEQAGAPGPAAAVLEAETGLTADDLMARISRGETIAALVQVHGGDLDKVKIALADAIRQSTQAAISAGTMQQAQADRMLGSLDESIASAVEGQLPQQFFDRLIAPAITGQAAAGFPAGGPRGANGGQPGANATAEVQSGASGTAEVQAADGTFAPRQGRNTGSGAGGFRAQSGTSETPEVQPSDGTFVAPQGGTGGTGGAFNRQPTALPTATATPFPTATGLPPRPTTVSPTPTNTPFVIATMTPTPAEGATPGAPSSNGQTGSTSSSGSTSAECAVYPNHNVNLRGGPSIDDERLLTIPASSYLEPTGRTDDSAWMRVTYQDQTGWVSAEYLDIVGNCDRLPVPS